MEKDQILKRLNSIRKLLSAEVVTKDEYDEAYFQVCKLQDLMETD